MGQVVAAAGMGTLAAATLAAGAAAWAVTAGVLATLRLWRERREVIRRLGAQDRRGQRRGVSGIGSWVVQHAERFAPRALGELAAHDVVVRRFAEAGIVASAGSFMIALLIGLCIAVATLVITTSALLAFVALAVSAAVGWMWLGRRAAQRADAMRAQIPSLFIALSSAMGAGMSLQQAVQRAGATAGPPLDRHLANLSGDLELGAGAGPALERFASATELPELRPLAVAIGVQQLAGGEVVSLVEHAAEQLRQDEHVRDLVQAKTAQGRLSSGMVTAIPVVLTVGMALLSPGYLDYFFADKTGRMLLSIAVVLQVMGVVVVRRVLALKVR